MVNLKEKVEAEYENIKKSIGCKGASSVIHIKSVFKSNIGFNLTKQSCFN